MKRKLLTLVVLLLVAYYWYDVWQLRYDQISYQKYSHLHAADFLRAREEPKPIGIVAGDPLSRLGLSAADLTPPAAAAVSFVGKTRYLNNAHAVVTHTIDDSTPLMPVCLDTLDRYDVKATIFTNTDGQDMDMLWERFKKAAANGHEVASHSRRHQCQRPDTELFCFRAFSDYEVDGSREDIVKATGQPYVWSFAYPCGSCADYPFVQKKLARAGFLVARSYPGEAEDKHNVPNLRTYAENPMNATYTQVVQKRGGVAKMGRTDVPTVNKVFDDVYAEGGIYHFVSHPYWLDYGPEAFYEQHLQHISRKPDVWYVPLGPLYAFQTVREKTQVKPLAPKEGRDRFAVFNDLDPVIYGMSVTLEFDAPADIEVRRAGQALPERPAGYTTGWNQEFVRRDGGKLYVTARPGAILEFAKKA